MQDGDTAGEAAFEAFHQLRGEGDLRDQHQRGFPLVDNVGDRLQVDLGLAAAGHAMEKERDKPLRIGCGGYSGE